MKKDSARIQTDKKLNILERKIAVTYRKAYREIGISWKKYLEETEREIADLTKKYEEAKKSGDEKQIKSAGIRLQRAKREKTLLDKKYKAQTEALATEIYNVNKTVNAYINNQLPEVYTLNYNEMANTTKHIKGYSFNLTNPTTVKNLLTEDKSLLPLRELEKAKDIRWNVRLINNQVLQGILQGESMQKIAERLTKVKEMNMHSAITAARTMVTSAENKGRLDSYEKAKSDGIKLKKRWVSSNQVGRTRHAHMPHSFNSLEVDIDEPFINTLGKIMYPGDPNAESSANVYNCRCTMTARVIGFERKEK